MSYNNNISINGGILVELSLYKMHGSKNMFYLLEVETFENLNFIELTKWLCQKDNNGGADGLLLVLPSEVAQAKMRVINADGSEASMCGNGLRCVARFICERDGIDEAMIETMKATLHVKKEPDILPEISTYSVEISPISFDLASLPMNYGEKKSIQHEVLLPFSQTILFSALSVPNPHLIGVVDKYYIEQESHQFLLANYLNNNSNYSPDGVNLSYVLPISSDEIYVRTYERGVGFTNACGTAMTASALVAFKNGLVNQSSITVYNPGGFVKCSVIEADECYRLRLSGNATYVEQVICEIKGDNFHLISCKNYEEALQYDKSLVSIQPKIKIL